MVRRVLGSPYLALTLAPLCWSGNWLLGRAMHAEVTPVSLNFWRWTVALAVLLPLALPALWAARGVLWREWRILALLGALGVTLFQTLIYLALQSTTAVNAALVNSVMPVAIVAIAWLLDGDRVTRRQALGMGLSLAGVVVVVGRGDPTALLGLRVNPGDLWALASVPAWSLYTVLFRRRPPGLAPWPLLLAIALLGWLGLWPLWLAELAIGGGLRPTPASVGTVLYLGVVASVVAFAVWNRGVAALGAGRSGVFLHLLPAFTTIEAVALLGERLEPYHAAGVLLIVGGISLTTVGGTPAARTRRAAPSPGTPR